MKRILLTVLMFGIFGIYEAMAQVPCSAESPDYPADNSCPAAASPWTIANTPLSDGSATTLYHDPDNNIVSLYGSYGNTESSGAALTHYNLGITLGGQVQKLGINGSPSSTGKIVMLVLGFSNCDIEVCGGSEDIWQSQRSDMGLPPLYGQPCATFFTCPNLGNAANVPPYFEFAQGDMTVQQSLLYQVYSPTPALVGPDVVIFNGTAGAQTLANWEPDGYYLNHACPITPEVDGECDYDIVSQKLAANGFSEAQVQVIFFKSATGHPLCDLKKIFCAAGYSVPDAYNSEQILGKILRYLKCCKGTTGQARYPNLKQAFLTSRIYGGYANGTAHACTSPEPYAYEEGFAVQRLIAAQINGGSDPNGYSGAVDTGSAPWFDWGPYLWADGKNQRSDGLTWCNGQNVPQCLNGNELDLRYGDTSNPGTYWGDFTHPTAQGAQKAASQMVKFFTTSSTNPGSPFTQPWNWK